MVVEDGIPEPSAFTVHEGVHVERIAALPAADVRKELWLPPGRRSSATSRALVPHKGQRYLVDAAPAVVRALPDTHFLIFGEGELRPALQQQIKRLGLEHHVSLVGFRADVLALLKSFDLFVMSSVTEGLGTSILDAMAASKAVVGTTAGGIPEAVEHGVTGLLVPPHHADALADAILTLLKTSRSGARMGEAGLARVRALFSVDRMVDETLAVYERAAGRPRAAGNGSPPPACLKPHRPSACRCGTGRSRTARDPTGRAPQRRGDLGRHPPARRGVARQAQAAAHADDVHVERHDEPRRRHARPDAEVDGVVADHPAQEQIEALAGAASAEGSAKNVRTRTRRHRLP